MAKSKPDPMQHDGFVLQFNPSEIAELAARYGPEQDHEAFGAGNNIRGGNYSRENLKVIVRWKSARKIAFIDENTDREIANALRFATNPHTSEKSAIDTLDRLHGVGIPMASAILTTIYPEKYTVIDIRALESLGVSKWPTDSLDYYVSYLRKCRELSQEHHVSLRTLDRALWQWSKEHGKPKTSCV
jgi:hypothetical protein